MGRKMNMIGRWGKQIYFTFEGVVDDVLTMHLGMTGFIQFRTSGSRLVYESSSSAEKQAKETVWPPKFAKLLLAFADGEEMIFADARRLGRFAVIPMASGSEGEEPQVEQAVRMHFGLGFDPLLALPTADEFSALLANRSRNLKQLLLDQSFVAGIGNWMADDILLEAGLHPLTKAGSLTVAERGRLLQSIWHISHVATVEANADKREFPKEWLFHVRWARTPPKTSLTGVVLKMERIGGRSTFYAPSLQKRKL